MMRVLSLSFLLLLCFFLTAQAQQVQSLDVRDSGTEDRYFLAANEGRLYYDPSAGYMNSSPTYALDLEHNWLKKVGSSTRNQEWRIGELDTLTDSDRDYVLRGLDITDHWSLNASRSKFAQCDFIYRIDHRDSVFGSRPLFQIEYSLKLKNVESGKITWIKYDSALITSAGYETYLASSLSEEPQILSFPDLRYGGAVSRLLPESYAVVSRREPTQLEQLPGCTLIGIDCDVRRLARATLYVRGLRVRSDNARPRPDAIPTSRLPAQLRTTGTVGK